MSSTLPRSLEQFMQSASPSWVDSLSPDPDAGSSEIPRRVRSGHYVIVQPTPLPDPELVFHSADMASTLGLDEEAVRSEEFCRFFGADQSALPGFTTPFATPYALCIYGEPMYRQCPFGTGEGYGDGRAISVAEVKVGSGRWDLQLKGAGRTPFARTGDGRAVLRSSIREFLASEAMHALGVSTTRALSLVVSRSERVSRPWYNTKRKVELPPKDDPRLLQFPEPMREMLLQQLKMRAQESNLMVQEPAAITCRVAPSFLRIGHVDLFARRVRGEVPKEPAEGEAELALVQLRQIVEHMRAREFPECTGLADMLRASAERIAGLTADWIRVGFVQGNFNSDNCLVAGRTMDYGPFGWVERFEPLWNMWVGGGDHFGFLNQMRAGEMNFTTLAKSVLALGEQQHEIAAVIEEYPRIAATALSAVYKRKLGVRVWGEEQEALCRALLLLMEKWEADWTMTWRQLAHVAEGADTDEPCLAPLDGVYFGQATADRKAARHAEWLAWVRKWKPMLHEDAPQIMRAASPKYVAREWMLVEAYEAAQEKGNFQPMADLHKVLGAPYEEQPEMEGKYYRLGPGEGVPGTSFMS